MSAWLHLGSAILCLGWMLLVLGVGRGRRAVLLAASLAAAACWAASVALTEHAGLAEALRSAVWFAVLLLLWRQFAGESRLFGIFAALGLGLALVALLPGGLPIARVGLAFLVVLMAENLYRAAPAALRWHVVLPCLALGGLAAFDLLIHAHAALTRGFSPVLIDARAVLTACAAPLLAIAAFRDRRLRRDPPVSRQVVFHGATLAVAGTFLLGIGAAGEALRQFGDPWARTAQVVLVAAALLALAVALSAQSLRSRLRRLIVDHFFHARYDYRREWLRCVATLADAATAHDLRAIRAIADPVDSPAGLLLLRGPGETTLRWAGAWNRPAVALDIAADHPLLVALRGGSWVAHAEGLGLGFEDPWLVVPLTHPREGLLGAVLLARPRAALVLDAEVFDLLRTLGREVAMFLAERQAAEALADQAALRTHADRFAFVAHDIKTVASQLTLLLANAEAHLANPAFQQDMLLTVRAAAERIARLIQRLRVQEAEPTAALDPLSRLRGLTGHRAAAIELIAEETSLVAMAPEAFDAAVTHLLDNAMEAAAPGSPVRLRLHQGGPSVLLDITDDGPGMSADFVRDTLFRPLATSKPRGSGIGAWQARALLRGAGGDLAVLSRPGEGTTMRLTLPRAGRA